MIKKRARPLPKPTKKLYRCYDLSFYHDKKSKKKPCAVEISFSELFLNPNKSCFVFVRTNLRKDMIARLMRERGTRQFPMCGGAINYANIWSRHATYLCDESGGGNPNVPKTYVWYKIDNTTPDNKVVRKVDPNNCNNHLTFSEFDKVDWNRKFEFDGSFTDLLNALRKEGFKITD